jgi:hypothetical protein
MNTPETDNAADGGNFVHIFVAQRLETERDAARAERDRLLETLERIARNMKSCAERWQKFPHLRHTEIGAIVAAQHIAESEISPRNTNP